MTAKKINTPCKGKKDSSKPKNDASNFPARLHYMLQEIEKDGLDHIVCWRPHGRAFMVVDQEAFAKEILPLWFRQSKYSSFQRQLNLYGFKRITSGTDKGSHYHECFLRGMASLTSKIVRTKVKGTGTRKPRCLESEPNFYAMTASMPSKASPAEITDSPTPSVAGEQPTAAPQVSQTGTSVDQLLALAFAQRALEQRLLAHLVRGQGMPFAQPSQQPEQRSPSPPVPSSSLTSEQSLLLAHLIGTKAI
eukprot:CAMPEP_0172441308 /NCGR_PEP_ID=MMETSP1065-20121228/1846_1 /TAXON_ID=265537 /ORGANISM="Amphiprora paludosa, Strain CCMP125" /LENGTH=248 /DNA_ID=CAMNT_0013190577 /DNA_START=6 /DNA_END=752 /DNA_ORIENTATION=-